MSFRSVYGYNYSENGWRMCNRDECEIAAVPMQLIDTAPLRRGAPHTILGAWLLWYDRNIDTEVDSPVWGWSNTNEVANSNHLSGTAVDINAPRYPWGARTMSAGRIVKIREGLRLFEGLVFWGADWDRADEMHFQMNYPEGDPRNDAFAAKLRAGYLGLYGAAPTTPPTEGDDMANMTDDEKAEVLNAARRINGVVLSRVPAERIDPSATPFGAAGVADANDVRVLSDKLDALTAAVGAFIKGNRP